MRSIEDLAAEEEARLKRLRDAWLARAFTWLCSITLVIGMALIARDELWVGSLLASVALTGFLARSGALAGLGRGGAHTLLALFAGLGAFGAYRQGLTGTFSWGEDPGFWLATLEGRVVEPSWSPLSYLIACAATLGWPLLEAGAVLPSVSALTAGLALALAVRLRFAAPERGPLTGGRLVAVTIFMAAFALSRPVSSAALLASGLPASIGLILFLLLDREISKAIPGDSSRPAILLLTGLLVSTHWLWGALALGRVALSRAGFGRGMVRRAGWLLAGLVPLAWIPLRAGRAFPSWGGGDPYGEWIREGWRFLREIPSFSRGIHEVLGLWGLGVAWLILGAVVRTMLSSRTQSLARTGVPWAAAVFLLGTLASSPLSGLLAPVAPLLPLLLLEPWLPPSTVPGRRPAGPGGVWGSGLALGTVLLAFWPVATLRGDGADLPRRHALNLMVAPGPRTAILFEDPYEADACRLLQLTEGAAPGVLILDRGRLGDRDYLAGLIRHRPDWIFGIGVGSEDAILQDMVANNVETWDVRWTVRTVPRSWDGPASNTVWVVHPQVLFQQFVPAGPEEPPYEDLSARMDLSGWIPPPEKPSVAYRRVRSRYTEGFMDVGDRLVGWGRYPAAIRCYERASRLDPDFEAPKAALARLYEEKRFLEAARLEFARILKEHPSRIRYWMARAGEFGSDGRDPRVLSALDTVVRLNEELADAQYRLGLLFQREGREREGRELIETSARTAPQRIEVQLELGRQHLRAGNRVGAEEAFRAVLGIDPQNKEAQKQLWRLLNRP